MVSVTNSSTEVEVTNLSEVDGRDFNKYLFDIGTFKSGYVSSGANTLYTVPVNKKFIVLGVTGLIYLRNSGGTNKYYNGGSNSNMFYVLTTGDTIRSDGACNWWGYEIDA